jgi:hypothetical protein
MGVGSANGYKVTIGGKENVLKIDCGDDCITAF